MKTKLLLIILAIAALAQRAAGQQMTLKCLGAKEGLENGYMTSMAQDSSGCVWMGTEMGLYMFDGRRFTAYTQDNCGIAGNGINTLYYECEKNTLWIGTKSGLSRMDCDTKEFEEIELEGMVNIYDIAPTSEGRLWIISVNNIIALLDPAGKEKTLFISRDNVAGLPNYFRKGVDDGKGKLYLAYDNHGVGVIDLSSMKVKTYTHDPENPRSLPSNYINCIMKDSGGRIWIGAKEGLILFDAQREEFFMLQSKKGEPASMLGNDVRCIYETRDGKLWIGTFDGGVSVMDLSRLPFQTFNNMTFKTIRPTYNSFGLSSGAISTIFEDSYGNKWIGNYGAGVDCISHRKPSFSLLNYLVDNVNAMRYKSVTALTVEKDDRLWVGSRNEIAVFRNWELLRKYDISSWSNHNNITVNYIQPEGDGNLLVGTNGNGLFRLDTRTGEAQRIETNEGNSTVRTIFKDTDGKYLIGTESGVMKLGAGGKVEMMNGKMVELDNRIVTKILRDRQGKLWVATFGSGVFVFDKQMKQLHKIRPLMKDGKRSGAICDLLLDSKGGIWIASRECLTHITSTEEPERMRTFSGKDGMASAYVNALAEDSNGNIWLSTSKGVSKLDTKVWRFYNYDYHDGLPNGTFNEGTAAETSTGTIFFGSDFGACAFRAEDVKAPKGRPELRLISFSTLKAEGNELERDSVVNIGGKEAPAFAYNENSFRIVFSVCDFALNDIVEYAYCIEEQGDEWRNIGSEGEFTLRDLAPGKYTVRIKVRLKNMEWDEEGAIRIRFKVNPPVWMSWYAYLLYAVVIAAAVFYFLRFYKRKAFIESALIIEKERVRNATELNEERMRFYTNITHELRTPLTLIIGPLEDLMESKGGDREMKKKIQMIHQSAQRLLQLVNKLLEFRTTETQNKQLVMKYGSLSETVKETALRFKELNENKSLNIEIDVEEGVDMRFDTDIVTTIITNLLSNAVKYTPEGEITVRMKERKEETEKRAVIEVRDTGYGISEEALPHIFERYYQAKGKHQASGTGIGLALVKSLADLHGAEIEVESKEGEGSVFRMTLTDKVQKMSQEDEVQEDVASTEEKEGKEENLPLILVVEDNMEIKNYIAHSLAQNYRTITAENGKQGWEMAQAEIPDVIVSDIMMPELDGIEMCKLVKDDVRTNHIPVILLTAKDSMTDREKGYECGADSYLTKPFSAKLLRARISNILEARNTMAERIMRTTMSGTAQENEGMTAIYNDFSCPGVKMNEPERKEESRVSAMNKEFIEKLKGIIMENIDNPELDIAFITRRVYMSHSTFYRKVKALTGVSANEFIRKVRLNRSKVMLEENKYKISDITYMCGFSSLSYFRTCFKEEFGMSPSDYVKKFSN